MQLENKYTQTKKLVVGENDLYTWCKDHGEEGEVIIKEWNQAKNGSMKAYKAGSDKVVYWRCSICNKEYKKPIRERVLGSIHGPCGRKRGKERLRQWHREQIKFENSLAGLFPEMLKEWDYKKNKEIGFEPQYLSAYSSKKVHWICSKCKAKWVKEIRLRTAYGYGCRHCKNK